MQITQKSADGLAREFSVVVAADAMEQKISQRLEEVGQQVRLPGFRPGKVPMNLLRKRFGDSVRGEVLEKTIDETIQATITEKSLKPALRPQVDVVDFGEGKDLQLSLKMEILPDIVSGDFGAIELEKWSAAVDDAAVAGAIDELAKRNRESKTVTEHRKSVLRDLLVVEFIGRIDGKPFEGGTSKNSFIELGAGRFIAGFEDQMIGSSVGDTVIVKVKFPPDYGVKEIAGKDAEFEVKVNELREIVDSEINDDFARKVGAADVEDLKKKTRDSLQRSYDRLSRLRLKRQLLDKLASGHEFPVPNGMVEAEFNAIWRQIEQAKTAGRLDAEDAGKDDDQLKTEYRAIATRRVRLGLLLSDVGQKNNIVVTQEELTNAAVSEAMLYPGQEQAILNYYRNNPGSMESLRPPVFEDKVVDFILELAKVATKTVSYDELKADTETPPDITDALK
jgi:trigger factor